MFMEPTIIISFAIAFLAYQLVIAIRKLLKERKERIKL